MKVCETFVSHQGEINVGRFAFFIRLGSCNLKCVFCDTAYARDEYVDVDNDMLVEQALHFPRVILTGGEPFVQKEDVAKFIEKLTKKNPDVVIEIETNGTIKPVVIGKYPNVIYNVSIKLKNSGNEYEKRVVPGVVNWFNQMKANFKFVVDTADDVDEVQMICNEFSIPKHQVFLMPEGKSREEQTAKLHKIVALAKLAGYNFSPRMHVLLWGTKRGV